MRNRLWQNIETWFLFLVLAKGNMQFFILQSFHWEEVESMTASGLQGQLLPNLSQVKNIFTIVEIFVFHKRVETRNYG